MKKIRIASLIIVLFGCNAVFAESLCDTYDSAIKHCAKQGCDTTIDDFSLCLIEEEGISEKAEDGTDEISELIHCFHTEYSCK